MTVYAASSGYADVGAGITLTEIRAPDLGGAFQFNPQAVPGVNYFLRDDSAISFEGRYLHLSSAGIYKPNNAAFCRSTLTLTVGEPGI
jgi:hypothetical protein